MEWFIIEALVALAVGVAIVWWTITPSKKLPPAVDEKSGDAKSGDAAEGNDKTAAARKAD
jgi:hypothetical protein